jgi:hypothetical protein
METKKYTIGHIKKNSGGGEISGVKSCFLRRRRDAEIFNPVGRSIYPLVKKRRRI